MNENGRQFRERNVLQNSDMNTQWETQQKQVRQPYNKMYSDYSPIKGKSDPNVPYAQRQKMMQQVHQH